MLFEYWKLNFLSLMEYKVSFLTSIVSMFINNTIFVACWYFFFLRFWTIWWMDFWNFALLSSIMIWVFVIIHIFFWWYINIPQMIEQWKLDSQLLLPKNILVRILASRMDSSAFWDLLYIVLLMFFIPDLSIFLILKIIFVSILWAATYLWFLLIFISMAFHFWSSKNLVKWVLEAILWPGHYPPWIFEWTILKYIFMTILPVFYIVFLPYELALNFSWKWIIILILWSLFFITIWVFSFYFWLKKYESWSMMNTNV